MFKYLQVFLNDMKTNILITGIPRSGKSTLLKKIFSEHKNKHGFITNEICEDGERIGFEIENHLGEKSLLAKIDFVTPFKVSKYYVNLTNLDNSIFKLSKFKDEDLLFIDEIGQMELFSENFKKLVHEYLDSSNISIMTLSKVFSDDFIEQIKKRDDIIIIEISSNIDMTQKYIVDLIDKIIKAKKYVSDKNRFVKTSDTMILKSDHGVRNLKKREYDWVCDCEFFQDKNICSHQIAVEEFLRLYK